MEKININKIKKKYKIVKLEIAEKEAVLELEEIYTINWGYSDDFEVLEGDDYKIESEEFEIEPPNNQGCNYHYRYVKKIIAGKYVLVRYSEDIGNWRKKERHLLVYNPERVLLEKETSEITKKYKEKEKEFFSDLKRISEMTNVNDEVKQKLREEVVIKLNKWRMKFLKNYKENLEIITENEEYYGVNCKIYSVVSDDGELLFWVRDIPEPNRVNDAVSKSYYELADFIYSTF